MKNITYLIGAGASANTLPTVNLIPEIIENQIKFWKHEYKTNNKLANIGREEYLKELYYLHKNIPNHASIDTFAKKLFLTGDDKYYSLKCTLNILLLFEQKLKKIDKRYDLFYASILSKDQKGLKIPSNIKIISWNYDSLFEKALLNFNNDIFWVKEKIQLKPYNNSYDNSQFGLLKLNGSIGIETKIDKDKIQDNFRLLQGEPLKDCETFEDSLMTTFSNTIKRKDSLQLTFAWESTTHSQETIKTAIEWMKSADILIVIGYSFPFFNRDIDSKLLNLFIEKHPKFDNGIKKKLYINELNEESSKRIRSKIIDLTTPHISYETHRSNNIEEFIIPSEF